MNSTTYHEYYYDEHEDGLRGLLYVFGSLTASITWVMGPMMVLAGFIGSVAGFALATSSFTVASGYVLMGGIGVTLVAIALNLTCGAIVKAAHRQALRDVAEVRREVRCGAHRDRGYGGDDW